MFAYLMHSKDSQDAMTWYETSMFTSWDGGAFDDGDDDYNGDDMKPMHSFIHWNFANVVNR